MNRKALISTVALLAALYAGVTLWQQRQAGRSGSIRHASLLPAEAAQSVAKVTIESAKGAIHLVKTAEGSFGVEEEEGFPADPDRVSKLFTALQQRQRLVRVSRRPERHAKLGVALDKGAPTGDTLVYTFEDDKGATLGRVILGGRRQAPPAAGTGPAPVSRGERYARLEGDEVWLVSTLPPTDVEVERWVDKRLLGLEVKDVAAVTIHPKGETPYRAVREGDEWKLADGPPDRRLTAPTKRSITTLVEGLTFTHMAKRAATDPPEEAHRITIETTEGTTITLTTFEEDREGTKAQVVLIDAAGETDRAKHLTTLYAPRRFEVPAYKVTPLLKPLADLTETVEPTPTVTPVPTETAAGPAPEATPAETPATP